MLAATWPQRTLSATLLALCLIPSPALAGTAPEAAASPPCVAGWGPATLFDGSNFQDVQVLGPDRAVAVGTAEGSGVKREPAWAWWDGTAWTPDQQAVKGVEGLMAVSGSDRRGLWTVGFFQGSATSHAIARRWTPAGWVADDPPRPQRAGEVLVAVDVDPTGGVWAVGMRADPEGVRTGLAWHHSVAGGWSAQPGGRAGSSFTGVAALAADDVWVVGSRSGRWAIVPIVRHWDGTRWVDERLPDLGTEAVLTSIAGLPGRDLWAVGWRAIGEMLRPLVLRRHHGHWVEGEPPGVGGTYGMLLDVSVDALGRPWVGGATYEAAGAGYVGFVARRDGVSWTLWPPPADAPRWVSALTGDPATTAWIAAEGGHSTMLRSVCEPPAGATPSALTRRQRHRRGARVRPAIGHPDASPGVLETLVARPLRGSPAVARLAPGVDLPGWVARDVAAEAGMPVRSTTYGADVGDLDGDGRNDLFLSQHGGLPSLFLGNGSGYELQARDIYARVDRHDCAIGQIAGEALPDVVCVVGADGGTGLKSDELWLDPGSGTTSDVAAEHGVADPLGRGRSVTMFDADGDGDLDVFLGNQGTRYDGQPTPNRLMINDGTGQFTWDPASGLTSDRGAGCVQAVDIDLDDDMDLILCADNGSLVGTKGMIVERNDGDRFRDVTRAFGVQPLGEVDAVAGQLGGSARPDLVQLSAGRIRIGLWRDGRFRTVFERRLKHGRGLALGDVDGDGATDIYVQMGARDRNDPDVVLHNDGTGRDWTPIAVPSATDGRAESVLSLDYDGDGRDDFLVLNGWLNAGPIELITFQPAGVVAP